jgi:hypothetical protein
VGGTLAGGGSLTWGGGAARGIGAMKYYEPIHAAPKVLVPEAILAGILYLGMGLSGEIPSGPVSHYEQQPFARPHIDQNLVRRLNLDGPAYSGNDLTVPPARAINGDQKRVLLLEWGTAKRATQTQSLINEDENSITFKFCHAAWCRQRI